MNVAGVTVTNSLLIIPIEQVHPGQNTRGPVGNVDELAASIAAQGQLVPTLVSEDPHGGYELFDGERRWTAIRQLHGRYIKAVLRSPVDGPERVIQQLTLSSNGKRFDPIAESDAVYRLYWTDKLPEPEIARRLGHSPRWVRDRLSLHYCTPSEREQLRSGRASLAGVLMAVAGRRAARDGREPAAKTSPKTRIEPCPSCGRPRRTP